MTDHAADKGVAVPDSVAGQILSVFLAKLAADPEYASTASALEWMLDSDAKISDSRLKAAIYDTSGSP